MGWNNTQMHGTKTPRVKIRSTTVLCVRRDNKVVMAGDGQVTIGEHVMKHSAKKIRRLYEDKVLAGFAGSTADALSLFGRFENKLQEFHGNLSRAAVELAKEWRTDRALRHLDALLVVADPKGTFVLSGHGEHWPAAVDRGSFDAAAARQRPVPRSEVLCRLLRICCDTYLLIAGTSNLARTRGVADVRSGARRHRSASC